MSTSPLTTNFTAMSRHDVAPFLHDYEHAVRLEDIGWLERNVRDNPQLTISNRQWLANLPLESKDFALVGSHAIARNNMKLLDFFLQEGASPDRLLPTAIVFSNSNAVKRLCAAGTDANMSYEGIPVLNLSAALFDYASCEHLIKAGAEINGHVTEKPNRTALYDCLMMYQKQLERESGGLTTLDLSKRPRSNELRTIGVLLEHGCDSSQTHGAGEMTAYALAASLRHIDPRPVNLIHEWQREKIAQAEMQRAMMRMRRSGSSGPV